MAIGRRKYEALKAFDFDNMDEQMLETFNAQFKITVGKAMAMVKEYEEHYKNAVISPKAAEYLKTVRAEAKKKKEIPKLTKEILWKKFNDAFYENEGVKFNSTTDSLSNLKPLMYYFLGDFENFKKCHNVSKLSVPSKDKGLLIIGTYGNGKTSIFKAFEKALRRTNIRFKGYSTNEAVIMFEACKSSPEKEQFYNLMNRGTRYFDDVKTERQASNYGKTELFKDIIESRYSNMERTYITCNFDRDYPDDLDKGLDEFMTKYGNRVYDRLFEMFNIVVFNGKSFRR